MGPKTAACVLLFNCGLPALPVDTHVHRVSRRLGLIGPRTGAAQAHTELEALVPPEQVFSVHVNLIRHGRQICKAPRPRCEICPLADVCPRVGVTRTAAMGAASSCGARRRRRPSSGPASTTGQVI